MDGHQGFPTAILQLIAERINQISGLVHGIWIRKQSSPIFTANQGNDIGYLQVGGRPLGFNSRLPGRSLFYLTPRDDM